MASKLFHAVVGVGISLGISACGGSVEQDSAQGGQASQPFPTAEGGADAGISLPKADAGSADSAAGVDGAADVTIPDAGASPDTPMVDAAPDVGKDAIVDAFCDDPWPITKSGRVVCGPSEACAGTPAPWCFGKTADGSCTIYPLACVDQQWQCLGGTSMNTPSPPIQCP